MVESLDVYVMIFLQNFKGNVVSVEGIHQCQLNVCSMGVVQILDNGNIVEMRILDVQLKDKK